MPITEKSGRGQSTSKKASKTANGQKERPINGTKVSNGGQQQSQDDLAAQLAQMQEVMRRQQEQLKAQQDELVREKGFF